MTETFSIGTKADLVACESDHLNEDIPILDDEFVVLSSFSPKGSKIVHRKCMRLHDVAHFFLSQAIQYRNGTPVSPATNRKVTRDMYLSVIDAGKDHLPGFADRVREATAPLPSSHRDLVEGWRLSHPATSAPPEFDMDDLLDAMAWATREENPSPSRGRRSRSRSRSRSPRPSRSRSRSPSLESLWDLDGTLAELEAALRSPTRPPSRRRG